MSERLIQGNVAQSYCVWFHWCSTKFFYLTLFRYLLEMCCCFLVVKCRFKGLIARKQREFAQRKCQCCVWQKAHEHFQNTTWKHLQYLWTKRLQISSQASGNPRNLPLCYCGPYTVLNLQSSMTISEMVYTIIDNKHLVLFVHLLWTLTAINICSLATVFELKYLRTSLPWAVNILSFLNGFLSPLYSWF